ncbi:alpha-amylase [Candidatus Magnetoovum chiemensis]|nr:alpha-amylase [Candidatus Magnetoovum chiemensis]
MKNEKKIDLDDDPLWYKDAVIYELHIKAFYDANGDGIGDFKGLTEKLDYLHNLGITALWLLPFYPSPLKDDGYDIADYMTVHKDYGDLRDFKIFLKEAHDRGIRVITELVLNHTSDQHEWFQRSRKAQEGAYWRNFYVWNKSYNLYKDARIIFKDFERSNWTWDDTANSYYWHRFYSHQPDLNYDNPNVQKAMFKIVDYWFNMGVDGLRLDAVPYLFEREGTNCENLPETYEFLKTLRERIDKKHKNKMLLAEANQWPEDAAAYFGNGKACQMCFHFPVMPRIFMAAWMEDRFPIIDILEQTPQIENTSQWAMFLRNHDELTLEMVTDEERDYMYRVYARDPAARINLGIRRRLAPLLGNNRRLIELMNVLLFSLPGTPVIYYGDEIGMGDNYYLGDRNGVRTPMQWSANKNANFSNANPQRLYLPVIIDPDYHYETVNTQNQESNQNSLLWWMRRLISIRKSCKALSRGSIEFFLHENHKVLSFIRKYEEEIIMVVVNLSRFPEAVEIDLSNYASFVPEEIYGRKPFPIIRETPYSLTIGAHGYYFFKLKKQEDIIRVLDEKYKSELTALDNWENIFKGRQLEIFQEKILPNYLIHCRWFASKARKIQNIKIIEHIMPNKTFSNAHILFIEVKYTDSLPETYLLPVTFTPADKALKIIEDYPTSVICHLRIENKKTQKNPLLDEMPNETAKRATFGALEGILHDAVFDKTFLKSLLLFFLNKKAKSTGINGLLSCQHGKTLKTIISESDRENLEPNILKAEQSNTSVLYDSKLFLKFYRKLEDGKNPELEISEFLTHRRYPNTPAYVGNIEYIRKDSTRITIGIFQAYALNQGDGWKYTLNELGRYYERVMSKAHEIEELQLTAPANLPLDNNGLHPLVQELIGAVYQEMASLLGERTAELHITLASEKEHPDFTNEPFTTLYQRSIYQSMLGLTKKSFQALKKTLKILPENMKTDINEVLKLEDEIAEYFKKLLNKQINTVKIRIHGDLHLGQALYTGNDFLIIDFEGEPARSLSERKLKRSPLRDTAGMMRSFHYAAHTELIHQKTIHPEKADFLELWANLWYKHISNLFLTSYIKRLGKTNIIPKDQDDFYLLLNSFLLEKAIYELGYELNNRPQWLSIPIKGIKFLIETAKHKDGENL